MTGPDAVLRLALERSEPSAWFVPSIDPGEERMRGFRDVTDGLSTLNDSFEILDLEANGAAEALGASRDEVLRRAREEHWVVSHRAICLGRPYTYEMYSVQDLPVEVLAKVLRWSASYRDRREAPVSDSSFRYDRDELWLRAAQCTVGQRERGQVRAFAVRLAEKCMILEGLSFGAASEGAARFCETHPWLPVRIEGVTASAIARWYRGRTGSPGAALYLPRDREAALIPRRGTRGGSGIPAIAWGFFVAWLLDSSHPSIAQSYRYTREVAEERLWGEIPSLAVFERRARTGITPELRGTARGGLQEAVCGFVQEERSKGRGEPA